MTQRAIVVATADDGRFESLQTLIESFAACGAGAHYDFGVLDTGLTADQARQLAGAGYPVVPAAPPFPGIGQRHPAVRALLGLPFLPDHFEAWDILVAIDAGSWLQDHDGIDLAVAGAVADGFAVLPLTDLDSLRQRQQADLARHFGPAAAARLAGQPLLADDFLAGRRHAPHWAAWQQWLLRGLAAAAHAGAGRAALAMAVGQAGLTTHFLPPRCHWRRDLARPGLDAAKAVYVEPAPPHAPLSAIGCAAADRATPVLVTTTDGRRLSRLPLPGLQERALPLPVTIDGAEHRVDGVATTAFRDQVFAALGDAGPVRFLQIGAMDGVAFDPIHGAVREHGWTGILVEPLPDLMARLQANYADQPGLVFVAAAIGEQSGRAVMRRVRAEAVATGRLPSWAGGLASLLPTRNALGGRGLAPGLAAAVARDTESVEVDCLSFADLASRHDLAGLDLIQIDAEGYDWRILDQIDLARLRPRCLHFEIACLPAAEIDLALARLAGHDYVCYAMAEGDNLLALRRDFGRRCFHIL